MRLAEPRFTYCSYFSCAHILCILAPKCLYKDYLEAKLYTIWVHGPLYPMPFQNPYGSLKGTLMVRLTRPYLGAWTLSVRLVLRA